MCVHVCIYAHACARCRSVHRHADSAFPSVLLSISVSIYSIHLLNLLILPIISSRSNTSNCFSFVNACGCFTLLISSFISEIIMLTLMSNYLAHSCLAYKLFTYHSSSVEFLLLACLLIFLLWAHIPLKLIMYHCKGRCLNLCPSKWGYKVWQKEASDFIIWAPISTFPGPQEPARLSPGSTLYEELPAKTLPGMSR